MCSAEAELAGGSNTVTVNSGLWKTWQSRCLTTKHRRV